MRSAYDAGMAMGVLSGRETREATTNVLRLYDTESNFSRYAKIRKNDRPERERNGLNRILGTRAVV